MALTYVQVSLMIGMLITGSINTLSKKAQNDCSVPGVSVNSTMPPKAHNFDHPWFQTVIMFMGEMLCLLGLCYQRKRERDEWRRQVILVIPTMCDLVGTSLAGIGLVYVDASVWQMLRGSIIIFAGILSGHTKTCPYYWGGNLVSLINLPLLKIFLKRKLRCVHWAGMIVTMFGLILVGCSSIFKNDHSASGSKTLLGIALIVGSQLVSASQMVLEETFLKRRNYPPLQVVGMEGIFGFFLMALAVLPAMYFIPGPQLNNSYENSLDAMYQIASDAKLLILCLCYLSSIAFYNYFGLAVTKSLTAVHRTLIDACRTIIVWAVDLFIFYTFSQKFGEEFDKTYGLLQVDGFLFLLIGTALYNELVDVPCIPWLRKQPKEMTSVKHSGNIQTTYEEEEENAPLLNENQPAVYS